MFWYSTKQSTPTIEVAYHVKQKYEDGTTNNKHHKVNILQNATEKYVVVSFIRYLFLFVFYVFVQDGNKWDDLSRKQFDNLFLTLRSKVTKHFYTIKCIKNKLYRV